MDMTASLSDSGGISWHRLPEEGGSEDLPQPLRMGSIPPSPRRLWAVHHRDSSPTCSPPLTLTHTAARQPQGFRHSRTSIASAHSRSRMRRTPGENSGISSIVGLRTGARCSLRGVRITTKTEVLDQQHELKMKQPCKGLRTNSGSDGSCRPETWRPGPQRPSSSSAVCRSSGGLWTGRPGSSHSCQSPVKRSGTAWTTGVPGLTPMRWL